MKKHSLEKFFKPNQTTRTWGFRDEHIIQVVASQPIPWNNETIFVVSGLAFGNEEVVIIDVKHMDFLDTAIARVAQGIDRRLAEYAEMSECMTDRLLGNN